ncbi:MAG: hypothetical protein FWD57_13395, partial [Polyangiaceae bacterium]|nr:hypothetical protein [Polyangiaceae bacterium]
MNNSWCSILSKCDSCRVSERVRVGMTVGLLVLLGVVNEPNWPVGPTDLSDPSVLCAPLSGDSGIRFSVQLYFGSEPPAPMVVNDNGSAFLAIDGQCRYWVKLGRYGHIWVGVLTHEEVVRFTKEFRLAEWGEFTGIYWHDITCTWSDSKYRFGSESVRVSEGGGFCGFDSARVRWLEPLAYPTLERLYKDGVPVGGRVRFKLVEFRGGIFGERSPFPQAVDWPLPTPAAVVAEMCGTNRKSPSCVLEGGDAALLR